MLSLAETKTIGGTKNANFEIFEIIMVNGEFA